MTFLTLEAISKSYGDTDAVRNVGLNIPARSRAAIVGPSGSGKTTLLRIIAGFEAPDSGQVTLGEQRLLDGDTAVPAHRRSIGYVAQEGSLFPHLSVGANVGFGIRRQDPRRAERIDRLLVQVGLDPAVRDRRPYELSGGQQQRVALARALARQPQLMLLDEPFSALDAGLREATRDMVGHVLRSAGITAILVTHDQAEALSFADYLAVMRDGQVVQAGAPQSLYRAPTDPLTAKFLGEAIILEADIANGLARTDLGMLGVAAGAADGRRMVMLRPEQISVAPLNGSGTMADTVGGTIVNRSFRGAAWRLVIQPVSSSDGRAFGSAITTDMSGDTVPSIGDPVRLRVTGVAHVFDGKS